MTVQERNARSTVLARFAGAILLAFTSLTACSDGTLSTDHLPDDTPQASYSAQDRRSAELLSIGNVGAIDSVGSPYRQATLCVVALETLLELVEASGTMTSEQREAIGQSRRLFEQRAQRAAASEDSINPIEERRAIEAQYTGRREQAQLALGCLRKLQ
ncbi:hypothetical protein [Qipengyuania spongiae]|uniref:Uncharacterized protein n=1 Tax=Qipengyuania spongiae TaxID=2909673 RepID=A0ABY5T5F8_9SPHN|nr:hypothetical protein [Qipengyuania spongiae]UVI40854.1 hypothetical protein L1F33_14445 [Qipengyuania spongiae]